jgi:hypothetical protein
MARFNSFHASITCPHCGSRGLVAFQADIGTLRWDDFYIGDVVINVGGRPAKPYGPSESCDFSRPFWATGLGTCPLCRRDLRVRIVIREGRFAEVVFPSVPDPDDGWGYVKETS